MTSVVHQPDTCMASSTWFVVAARTSPTSITIRSKPGLGKETYFQKKKSENFRGARLAHVESMSLNALFLSSACPVIAAETSN
mmetsp:Transcript_20213/g.42335  ORF Transcript_20213/g.42335 Transcript_20213/m.42335 type:complete len:83 (-) Transcript_20213:143-391(-)